MLGQTAEFGQNSVLIRPNLQLREQELKRNLFVLLIVLSLALIGTAVALPEPYRPYLPEMAVDGAMRTQTIDTLVARLEQIETLLRQRQYDGKYDAMTNGEQFAAGLRRIWLPWSTICT